MAKKNKEKPTNKLARMVKFGFDSVSKEFVEVKQRLDKIEERLDKIEEDVAYLKT